MEAFSKIAQEHADARLLIVGEWSKIFLEELMVKEQAPSNQVEIVGKVNDLTPYLNRASLYVHPSRGDAFPVSTLEAMSAGIPAIVSEWTGTAEVVKQVDPTFVVPTDPEMIVAAIERYFVISASAKLALSDRFRVVATEYGEERAVTEFREIVFDRILNSDGKS